MKKYALLMVQYPDRMHYSGSWLCLFASIHTTLFQGDVYGASIVLHNLFPSIQVGTFGYMFDIPLLILSVVLLGAKLGSRTIAAALITPLTDEYHIQTSLSYQRSIGSTRSSPTCRWKHELI